MMTDLANQSESSLVVMVNIEAHMCQTNLTPDFHARRQCIEILACQLFREPHQQLMHDYRRINNVICASRCGLPLPADCNILVVASSASSVTPCCSILSRACLSLPSFLSRGCLSLPFFLPRGCLSLPSFLSRGSPSLPSSAYPSLVRPVALGAGAGVPLAAALLPSDAASLLFSSAAETPCSPALLASASSSPSAGNAVPSLSASCC